MGVDVVTGIDIDRPRDVVAAFASDPDSATAWYQNITSVLWRTEPPLAIGTEVEFVAHFLGRKLVYTYVVAHWVPGERFVMRTSDGPFPMETTYLFEDTPTGGTRMTLRNRGEPSGFKNVAKPVLVAAMRRANRKDLTRLKRLLESTA